MTATAPFELTWLGQAAFHLRTPGGKSLFIDPWFESSMFPASWPRPADVDAILVTHAHGDHVGEAVALAERHKAPIVAPAELCHWLRKSGASDARAMNKGGTQAIADVRVAMVPADHSSGYAFEGEMVYGGAPVGFVVTLADGTAIYHAGDTNVFLDMALIGELHPLALALLPIGGHFTMGPVEAAKAVELLAPRFVVPMHYGTSPKLTGTPEQFEAALAARRLTTPVLRLAPGEPLCGLP
jgi:L-ascorbate metabolism protein UlaG (beta-lactamase superfamily)